MDTTTTAATTTTADHSADERPAPRRRIRTSVAVALTALAAAAGGVVGATPADAAVGECQYVYGSNGATSSGFARVCLGSFSSSGGSATFNVAYQSRQSAPNNVYVAAGFVFGGYNTGTSRLGANTPTTSYSARKTTSASSPIGVLIKLCYDKSFQTDPCYTSKVIYG